MKLLITSPDALIDNKTGNYFEGIIDQLRYFKSLEPNNDVVVVSIHPERLENIPEDIHSLPIRKDLRGSPILINHVLELTPYKSISDIIILGASDHDFYTAANSKVLFLSALYAKANNPYSRCLEYGLKISSVERLGEFFKNFTKIVSPWYFKLDVSSKTRIYALTNANTLSSSIDKDIVSINNKFKDCLKEGNETYREAFITYFLISTYAIVKEFEQVDYWGIYPSSGLTLNEDLEYFKEVARKSYRCREKQPIFIKSKVTAKRSHTTKEERLRDGCDSQLESIHLNNYYNSKKTLAGKVVCIIDDFTTYGSSCETARALLESAGVKKVIFIALGKYGSEYYKFDYQLIGNLFSLNFRYKKLESAISLRGEFNILSNFEQLDSLKHIL